MEWRIGPTGESLWMNYRDLKKHADSLCSLNVARLANIPEQLLNVAAVKSKELERSIKRKKISSMSVLHNSSVELI